MVQGQLNRAWHDAGSLPIAYTLATVGANKLWDLMISEPYVPALGALSGNQAMQMVRAGLKAVYCSGWQVSYPAPPSRISSMSIKAAALDGRHITPLPSPKS
jgi:isocitrate lyase